jgi:hypothetical protein
MDPVPDPLPLRKSGRAGNRTRDLWLSSQKLLLLDHRGGHTEYILVFEFMVQENSWYNNFNAASNK